MGLEAVDATGTRSCSTTGLWEPPTSASSRGNLHGFYAVSTVGVVAEPAVERLPPRAELPRPAASRAAGPSGPSDPLARKGEGKNLEGGRAGIMPLREGREVPRRWLWLRGSRRREG